jgi:hypothetical protein
MPMTLSGDGTITGLSAGGLPDSSIVTADIADAAITAAKMSGAQSGSAPIYGARAWVNFNGTGTVAIRASGNVTSITDNGTGDYTVNFTTAISDANYSVATCARRDPSIADNGNVTTQIGGANPSTTAVRVKCNRSDFAGTEDPSIVCVNIFR